MTKRHDLVHRRHAAPSHRTAQD